MKKIKLEILGISYSQSQTGSYALVLGESDGNTRLPIIIGPFEAQSIAIAIEKVQHSRPLTHDLFKSFALTFHISLKEIIINKYQEGIFYAKLICQQENSNHLIEIDSRTSDAVALAVRFSCPIYTYPHILSEAGISIDADLITSQKSEKQKDKNEWQDLSLNQLSDMLQQAVENEEYEMASKIRDEINKRKTNKQ